MLASKGPGTFRIGDKKMRYEACCDTSSALVAVSTTNNQTTLIIRLMLVRTASSEYDIDTSVIFILCVVKRCR